MNAPARHRSRPWRRVLLLFVPLACTPLLFHLIAEGVLNLGGGEKDLIWVVVWMLGALIFLGVGLVLMKRVETAWRWLLVSLALSLAVLVGLALALYLADVLGLAWGH